MGDEWQESRNKRIFTMKNAEKAGWLAVVETIIYALVMSAATAVGTVMGIMNGLGM